MARRTERKEDRSSGPSKPVRHRPGNKRQEEFDYKDVAMLQRFLTSQGKILSRKRSGLSAMGQRAMRRAIKRARFLGFLPFVA
jgi:small subunit ribosomal protein S18